MRQIIEDFDQQSLLMKTQIIEKLFLEQVSNSSNGLPTVAIVMATYNRFSYLLTYLYSLFLQENINVKLYISDDCSSDQTADYFEKWSQNYPDLLYYHYSMKGVGPSENRKIALQEVVEDFVILSDDDDYYINPNFLFDSVESICKSDGNISICFGSAVILDMETRQETPIILDYLGSSTAAVFSNLLFSMRKPPSTFLMIFKFSEELKQKLLMMEMLNDVSIYLLVLDYFDGNVGGGQAVSGIYREHASNITKSLDLDFMLDNFKQQIVIVKNSSLDACVKEVLIRKQNKMNIEYYLSNSVTTKQGRRKLYQTLKACGYRVSLWDQLKYWLRYSR